MSVKKYTYSKRAERDLIQIYKDTAKEWGVLQADEYNRKLQKTITLLADHPNAGQRCDEIKTGCRRFQCEKHLFLYRKRKADIFVIRILHTRMDYQRHV